MTDELRAKFEAWARDVGFKEFAKRSDGEYATFISRTMFDACQFGHASRDAEVEALKAQVAWMREYEKGLNRRAEVEEVLFEVARGKRPSLTADECRKLAIKLGSAPK